MDVDGAEQVVEGDVLAQALTASSDDDLEASLVTGVDLRRVRRLYDAHVRADHVDLTAVGVGACVAICGAIGFVGLVAPVFARRLTGNRPGSAILPAALIGAALLLAADLAVRTAPLGRTLPIGVATAVLGAPFFLWLVTHMRWKFSP